MSDNICFKSLEKKIVESSKDISFKSDFAQLYLACLLRAGDGLTINRGLNRIQGNFPFSAALVIYSQFPKFLEYFLEDTPETRELLERARHEISGITTWLWFYHEGQIGEQEKQLYKHQKTEAHEAYQLSRTIIEFDADTKALAPINPNVQWLYIMAQELERSFNAVFEPAISKNKFYQHTKNVADFITGNDESVNEEFPIVTDRSKKPLGKVITFESEEQKNYQDVIFKNLKAYMLREFRLYDKELNKSHSFRKQLRKYQNTVRANNKYLQKTKEVQLLSFNTTKY